LTTLKSIDTADFSSDPMRTVQPLLDAGRLPPRLGLIAAGFPLKAIEDHQHTELLNLLSGAGRYALRVGDDSMMAAGIFNGDIVIIQSQQRARNGDIVAALVDNEQLALKRIRYLNDARIRLFSDGPVAGFRDLRRERVLIQGKVIGQLRRYP
jgi:repressor LexA